MHGVRALMLRLNREEGELSEALRSDLPSAARVVAPFRDQKLCPHFFARFEWELSPSDQLLEPHSPFLAGPFQDCIALRVKRIVEVVAVRERWRREFGQFVKWKSWGVSRS
jgi:hypothetical protein